MRQIPGYQFSDGTFDDFFELFIKDQLEYNDYFNHILSWYNERERSNVCIITYEEMKQNLKTVVLAIANFIQEGGAHYLQQNVDILDRILHNCSFEEMKFLNTVINSVYDNYDRLLNDPSIPKGRKHIIAYNAKLPVRKSKIDFVRKGEVGGWKTVLTTDKNKRMDEKIKAIEHCINLMKIWKEIM